MRIAARDDKQPAIISPPAFKRRTFLRPLVNTPASHHRAISPLIICDATQKNSALMNAGNNSPGLLPDVAAQIKHNALPTQQIKLNAAFKIASYAQKKQTKTNLVKPQENTQTIDIQGVNT